ncbi:polyol phosphate phosphatase Pyp1p [Trichomonascus vanleenenianus]|uniref:putative phosphoric monoester hydrolase n=1 Tax=Trichomonascus vanleenenianus TaxID=2268995 RepID=UPI003ECB59F8
MSIPAMKTNPKMIVFTDWDGTVTLQDSNDYMTDNLGFGVVKRKAINQEILEGTETFRHGFIRMLESIPQPFQKCVEYLKAHVELDPGFADFYHWCAANNVPVVVVSSGMKPIIEALLGNLLGPEAVKNIEIIANDVKVNEDGSWHIVYRDESSFGHDKSRAIRPYAQLENRPPMFYCGDGVSDLSAARETDLLFAKRGRDLVTYCERENIPFTLFDSFKDIHSRVQQIYEGKLTIDEARK